MEHYTCLRSQHLACRDWDTIPSPRTAQDTQWFQSQTELRAKTIFQKTKDCEFGSVVKRVQSMHRTWLDPQKLWKNIARCICSLRYDLLPSVLGNLTTSYLFNWEVYPCDKGSSFYQSTDGDTDHEKRKVFLLWKFREVWPSLMRRSDPLPPFQALTFHLIKPRFRDFCPSSQEGLRQEVERTSGTSTFQRFQNHSNPKALRSFLSLGNNIPAIYFMIKISEYESFQNLKEDTDLSTVEWFPKSKAHLLSQSFASKVMKDHRSHFSAHTQEAWIMGAMGALTMIF